MATSPKESRDKSVSHQVGVSVFTHNGREVTVTMIDPYLDPSGKSIPISDGGSYSGGKVVEVDTPKGKALKAVGAIWTPPTWAKLYDTPPANFTEPVAVLGNYCPASFRVDGLDYGITFKTGISDDKSRVVIKSLDIGGDDLDRKSLGSLPIANLLDNAINASTFLARAYPPNYKTTLDGRVTFDSGPTGAVMPELLGVRRTTKDIRSLKGEKLRGRHKALDAHTSDEMIKRVADLWHSTPVGFSGGRLGYIQTKLQADQVFYHDSVVSKIIALARAKKPPLIPPVSKELNYKRGPKI